MKGQEMKNQEEIQELMTLSKRHDKTARSFQKEALSSEKKAKAVAAMIERLQEKHAELMAATEASRILQDSYEGCARSNRDEARKLSR